MATYKIGYYQFKPIFGKFEENLQNVLTALQNIEADLIVLPELPFTGYSFKDRNELESMSEDPQNSQIIEELTKLCDKQNFHLVTGFAENNDDKCFNSALLIGADGILQTYRKLHLFNEEKYWFDAGNLPLTVTNINGMKIGMMICFDYIFPEVSRTLTLLGADIICHPSNLVLDYCQKAMVTRCLENNIFTITTNRIGEEIRPHGSVKFTGKSQITAPKGKIIHQAEVQQANLRIVEIDIADARDKMITNTNHALEDRRPEFYKNKLK
ncbi:MAG: acyltransferase [Candidatus Marinimicrobia bacterium]|nr:acyltransferase [Candidatus Neomarinimicrobiota bacterium]MBL7022871.1 acyltransferase [Candidatus Neomarinimicrobiota bacterium]MBL7109190.1 acyltransferase [Candidatus Neomarinimicrobiota bacterium]